MKIAIYCRKSIYSDKSDSTQSQYQMCKEYAKRTYDTITSITQYEDEGFSGANTNRPSFQKLLSDIKLSQIDVLICYKIDRISRNVKDFSNTFDFLAQNNVTFVSIKEQIDTSTPLGRAMMYICSVFAQMERETIAERVKDNMFELAKNGKWCGGRSPFGYKIIQNEIDGKEHCILCPNSEDVPLLKQIFSLFLEGYSLHRLCTYLKENHITTPNGTFFYDSSLYRILTNPVYAEANQEIYSYFLEKGCSIPVNKTFFTGKYGVMCYGRHNSKQEKQAADKWIISIGFHEPLISSADWIRVQKKLHQNTLKKSRINPIGLLSGIIRCQCGCLMGTRNTVIGTNPNKRYMAYYCIERKKRGSEYCNIGAVKINLIDDKLLEVLTSLTIDKPFLSSLLHDSQTSGKKESETLNTLYHKKISLKKKIVHLTKILADSENNSIEKHIISEIEQLDHQLCSANLEIEQVQIEQEETEKKNFAAADSIYEYFLSVTKHFNTLPYSVKNNILKEVIDDCIWDGKELQIFL